MRGYKWTPAPGFKELEVDGRAYKPGDTVQISKERAEHMSRFGHVFDEVPSELTANVEVAKPSPEEASTAKK